MDHSSGGKNGSQSAQGERTDHTAQGERTDHTAQGERTDHSQLRGKANAQARHKTGTMEADFDIVPRKTVRMRNEKMCVLISRAQE
jgi:hypothetical protein